MKVNFNVNFKNLDGTDSLNEQGRPILINKILANLIVSKEAKENILQRFELAMKINSSSGEIEITDSEHEIIKSTMEDGRATVILAAQVLQIIKK